MAFTREQIIAQTSDRHLAVTASAGSGKTSVLVERFVRLLLDYKIPLKSIVAITFTKKAAAEMLWRVAHRLEKMLADESHKFRWADIKRIREQLSGARISTIHSFCSRILRDFPIEAGVSPVFSELDEFQKTKLISSSLRSALEQWLEHPQKNYQTRAILSTFSRAGVEKILTYIVESSERFSEIALFYEENDNEAIVSKVVFSASQIRLNAAENYIRLLEEFHRHIDPSILGKSPKEQYNRLSDLLFEANRVLERVRFELEKRQKESDFAQIDQEIRNIKSLFSNEVGILKSGGLSSKFLGAIVGNLFVMMRKDELSQWFTEWTSIEESLLNAQKNHDLLEWIRTFVEIAHTVNEIISAEKKINGLLDFDDMQMLTDRLLDDPTVREHVRRSIRFLMIDEFQDTNELQYRIARKLLASFDDSEENRDVSTSNFFVVGDPKQSIYGFRGADVRVFARAKQDIIAVNSRNAEIGNFHISPSESYAPKTEKEKYGNIGLHASFRLLPQVASFVNHICEKIMIENAHHNSFEVPYESMVIGRSGLVADKLYEGNAHVLLTLASTNSSSGKSAQQEIGDTSEARANSDIDSFDDSLDEDLGEMMSEASMVAEYLFEKMNAQKDGFVVVEGFGDSAHTRSAEWKDIAVLSRSRNGFDALAREFRRKKIPFIITSGSGFYNAEEIIDFLMVLRFLRNEADTLALAAALRSPLFRLSDTDLLELVLPRSGSRSKRILSWNSLSEVAQADDSSIASKRAYEILSDLRTLAPRLSVPSLLQTIADKTHWRSMIATDERAEQMMANFEKLLHYARSFEERGFKNFYDFVEEFIEQSETNEKESEAELSDISANAVKIMTIHASKGLEFPIVVLYNTNARQRNSSSQNVLFRQEFGLTCALPVVNPELGVPEFHMTPLSYLGKFAQQQAEEAELKRLLYVALTRAKDSIIVSATLTIKNDGTVGKKGGLWKLIAEGLGVEDKELLLVRSLSFPRTEIFLIDGQPQEKECELHVNVALNHSAYSTHHNEENLVVNEGEDYEPTTTKQTEETYEHIGSLLGEIHSVPSGLYVSATQLSVYLRSAEEYVRIYRLGLPPVEDDELTGIVASIDDTRSPDALLGTLAGTLFHAVMERYCEWTEEATAEVSFQKMEAVLDRAIAISGKLVTPEIRQRILRDVRTLISTDFMRLQHAELYAAKYEQSFLLPVSTSAGEHFLTGKADVMVKTTSGKTEIWDWKTNYIGTKEDEQALVERYSTQLDVYLYFLALSEPDKEEWTARLLFTRAIHHKLGDEISWIHQRTLHKADLEKFTTVMRETIGKIALID